MIGCIPYLLHLKSKFFDYALTPLRVVTTSFLIIFLVVFDWNYFKPEYGHMGPLTDQEKFSGRAWMLLQTAGIYDYLPFYAREAPKMAKTSTADITEGKGFLKSLEEGTYWAKFVANIDSESSKIRINTLKFPGWKAFVDGRESDIFIDKDEKWGRMAISVPKGEHLVYVQLFNTPIRTFSDIVSLISFSAFGFALLKKRKMTMVNS